MNRRCCRCAGAHHARGLCAVHYARAARRDQLDPSLRSAVRLAVDLRWLLDTPGWTVNRVAAEAGVDWHTVVNVLRCRHRAQADTAGRIAAVCHTARVDGLGVRPVAPAGEPVAAAA